MNKVAAERRGVSVTASGKDSAATGCCAGSDAAAGDDVVGDEGATESCHAKCDTTILARARVADH